MYGLSSDTELSFLIGRQIVQIGVGEFQTIVQFDKDYSVSIEGECRIGDTQYSPGVEAGRKLLSIIGQVVISIRIIDEKHLEFLFKDGTILTILENEDFESYTITGPGLNIVV